MSSLPPLIIKSNRQNIAKAAGVVSISAVFVGVVSFLKDMLVGMNFGASASLDALLLVYSIPFFMGTVALAVIQATLIPIYGQIKAEGDYQQLQSFINKMFTFTAMVLTGVTIIFLIVAPQLIRWVANNSFSEEQIHLSLALIWLLLPIVPLMGFFGFFGGIFYAEKNFFLPILLTAISPVVIVICIWLGKGNWEIFSLGVGITLGWLLQALFITSLFTKHYFRPKINWALNDRRIHQFISLSWPLLIGTFFSGTTVIIDRAMATGLPTGSISALDYADRINILAIGGFSALQTAVFPFFVEQANQSNYKQLMHDFKQTISLLSFAIAPFILLAILFSQPLVALLFQRGAFDLLATIRTSQAMIGYMIGLLPMMVGMVGVRLAQALMLHKFIGFQGMVNPLFKIIFNLLLIPIFGLLGISLATSGMNILAAIIVLVGLFRYLRIMPKLSDLVPYLKIAIGLMGLSGIVYLLNRNIVITDMDFGLGVGYMLLTFFIGIVVYWAGCFLLGLEEARTILKVVWKMLCGYTTRRLRS